MKTLIKKAYVVDSGKMQIRDILIEDKFISKLEDNISCKSDIEINAKGKYLLPGVIDDQVHFREPGLTHKAEIYTEAKAAVAGGITSFIEMPNTIPNAITIYLVEEKFGIAKKHSLANYSFMLGATNDNLEEVLKVNTQTVAGVKIFMGSSTGNMLLDNETTLKKIFLNTDALIAVHCEDEDIIKKNITYYREKYGNDIPMNLHSKIRSEQACYLSSKKAINLAKQTGAKLHVFHISTACETELFTNNIPLKDKKITAEVCVHHLWFSDGDYNEKGTLIKWNPAVKTTKDRERLWKALLDDRLDIIATDHAPHTLSEKQNTYFDAPSGGPLVQHALLSMIECYKQDKISMEKIVEKMCHNPAILYQIHKRGFIKEGYFADLVLVDLNQSQKVDKNNVLYKCGWSPFEGNTFNSKIINTFVNGHLAYENDSFNEGKKGMRLLFRQ